MNLGFFIIGGIIFSVYIGLTMWNIFYSGNKQREENYPNMKKNDFLNLDISLPSDAENADEKPSK
jgi:hypothetical protein